MTRRGDLQKRHPKEITEALRAATAKPLSSAQERLWFLDQLGAGGAYNTALAIDLEGDLFQPALQTALDEIVRRHQVLRSAYPDYEGQPGLRIMAALSRSLPGIDLRSLTVVHRHREARRLAADALQQPFDLTLGPLVRGLLLRLAKRRHQLVLVAHEIVCGPGSWHVLMTELVALYGAFFQNRRSPLAALPLQFSEYARRQRHRQRSPRAQTARQIAWWRHQLAELEPVELPTDHPPPQQPTFRGTTHERRLPQALSEAIEHLARRHDTTAHNVFLATFQALLRRYGGQNKVAIGSPLDCRDHTTAALIGFFADTRVLATELSDDLSFHDLLQRTGRTVQAAEHNAGVPFDQLVAELQPERGGGRNPLFQVMFVVENRLLASRQMAGLRLRPERVQARTAELDLTLFLGRSEDGHWIASLEGSRDLFATTTVARMLGHFQILLAGSVANERQRLAELPLLAPSERLQVLHEWRSTVSGPQQTGVCFHQLLAAQVGPSSDTVAVVDGTARLTYGELAHRARWLAGRLGQLGVGPEVVVGVALDRSLDMVVAVAGVLRSGGALVALDPTYPAEQLAHLIADSRPALILTRRPLRGALPSLTVPVLEIRHASRPGLGRPPTLSTVFNVDQLFAILYTSGSTGRPKGVLASHRAHVSRLMWAQRIRDLRPSDRFLLQSPISFPSLVGEIFQPLACGAQLVLARPGGRSDSSYLAQLAQREKITVMGFLPSLLRFFLEDHQREVFSSLRYVFCAGEHLPPTVQDAFLTALSASLHKHYGTTEAPGAAFGACQRGERRPFTLGRATDLTLRIVDRHLRPQPIGVAGELLVGGVSLARGYRGQAGMTAERLVPDPFSRCPGSRLYRTGDLARWLDDGTLAFLGRIDHQENIRGHRVEPGEIESALGQHFRVREAVVVARGKGPGGRRLIAYLVPRGAAPSTDELRRFLERKLPPHKLPAAFVTLDALPRTAAGKLDRRSLPEPIESRFDALGAERPASPTETALAEIWAAVFERRSVSVDDSFFDLGGHSLTAIQVLSRVRQTLGVELTVQSLFEAPSVAELARRVDTALRARGEGTSQARKRPPIEPAPRDCELPLSFAQRRLWFMDQLEPGNSAYNLATAYELDGKLDPAALADSLREITRRHKVLRSRFPSHDGLPRLVITPVPAQPLAQVDLDHLAANRREAESRRLARQTATRPFNLATGPLLRITLVRTAQQRHILIFSLHHIVSDAWTLALLERELGVLYRCLLSGQPSPLADLAVQYVDVSAWQQNWLRGEILATHLDYWQQHLAGLPRLMIPTDRARPAIESYRGALATLELPTALIDALRRLGKACHTTLFMNLIAGFLALLQRTTGQLDLVIGTPVVQRDREELEAVMGLLVNDLVLRADLAGDPSAHEFLARVRDLALAAYAHQDLPFEKLVEELDPERELGRHPLFQVSLILHNAPSAGLRLPRLETRPFNLDVPRAHLDLEFNLWERGDGVMVRALYRSELFDATTVNRLLRHFRHLLASLATTPDLRLSQLPLFSRSESHQLLIEWNDTATARPADRLLTELFAAQAERAPDTVAVVRGRQMLTYGELKSRSQRLARRLCRLGIGPETVVALATRRSPEMMIGLLGILQTGGAYLPLDPEHPDDRLAYILDDCGASLVLTQGQRASAAVGRLTSDRLRHFDLQAMIAGSDDVSAAPVGTGPAPAPNALAYVIYTSGSTGRPKGVEISQHSLVNFVLGMALGNDLGADDSMLAVTTIGFDIAILELFYPLLHGARVELTDRATATEGHRLTGLLARSRATMMQATPAGWRMLLAAGWRGDGRLRVLCGGEAMPGDLAVQLLACGGELWNFYGPTETTVYSARQRIDAEPLENEAQSTSVPFGRPIENTRLAALDRHLRPVPLGVSGELYIGGQGLSRGYRRQPGLTAERFVPDPLVTGTVETIPCHPGARLYRTGDQVRRLAGGELRFVGRFDHQVKLRGFRIEPGEIEAVLVEHPAVSQAVVLYDSAVPAAEDGRLVAWVTFQNRSATLSHNALERFLRSRLPAYMVPATFVPVARMPLSPSGKVDRRALAATTPTAGVSERQRVAPRTPTEEILVGIWSEVLATGKAKTGGIGVDDNFFRLGGHSLLATQVVSRVRRVLRVEMLVRTLFERPTIAALASALDQQIRAAATASGPPPPRFERVTRRGELKLSFAQQRLWFLHQVEPDVAAYNMPLSLRLQGSLEVAALVTAIITLAARQESLRTVFVQRDGRPRQVILATTPSLPVVDLTGLATTAQQYQTDRLITSEAARPFDLGRCTFRALLVRHSSERHQLLLNLHHIITDAWSQEILLRELAACYRAAVRRKPAAFAPLPIQYADFAIWQRRWLRGETLETQLAYWRRQLADLAPLELATDRPRPTAQTYRGAVQEVALPAAATANLRRLSLASGTSLFMTLLAAFVTLLHRLSGQRDVVLGSPIAGRNHQQLEGLIGFFVNMLVLRSQPRGEDSFRRLLEHVRELALGAYAHQDLPFEKLVEAWEPERDASRHPLFQVAFALHNPPRRRLDLPNLVGDRETLGQSVVRFDLEAYLWTMDDSIGGAIYYNVDLFDATTLRRLAGHFERLLTEVGADPDRRLEELDLLATSERHQLLVEWNDTAVAWPRSALLHPLVTDQASRSPDAVAVVWETGVLSYRALTVRARMLAASLNRAGVGRETLVGVFLERSPELIVGLLAILEAGAAYLPLDRALPNTRLTFLLADAGVTHLLTRQALVAELPAHDGRVVLVDDGGVQAQSDAGPPPGAIRPRDVAVAEEQTAYVLYTSGSTGHPKGVLVPHAAITHHMRWMQDVLPVSVDDRVLHKAALSFDVSVWEIWAPLLAGAGLVLAPATARRDGAALLATIARQRVSVMQLVPSVLRALVELPGFATALGTVRRLYASGEPLAQELRDGFFASGARAEMVNAYGPTEAAVTASWTRWQAGERHGAVSIGRPLHNTRLLLLDPHCRPVPIGIPAELAIAGDGLARGYLQRPRRTATAFVPDPGGRPGSRLYRTGDLVSATIDGRLRFLGRIDHQVKIRGFRIEPGEIEAALRRRPEVRDAVVVARHDNMETGEARLAGYVVEESRRLPASRWQAEQVNDWQQVYEALYDQDSPGDDPTFFTAGWDSSYTDEPIPASEMREWVDGTVDRILALEPRCLLEIGCGTGLLLLRVAPHCQAYTGTDFSHQALERVRAQFDPPGRELSHVELLECRAEDFSRIPSGAFDTVLLNSVVQYFPSIDYLDRVLADAITATAPGGRVMIGDVRSLPLLDAFCAGVELARADGATPLAELRQRAKRRRLHEEELVIDPAYFHQLRRLPRVHGVRIEPKAGAFHNELNRFRYDVVLHLDRANPDLPSTALQSWSAGRWTTEAIRHDLTRRQPSTLALTALPNARLSSELRLLELLAEPRGLTTVAELRAALRENPGQGVDPRELIDLGHELSYEVELSWRRSAADGAFDVTFRQAGVVSDDVVTEDEASAKGDAWVVDADTQDPPQPKGYVANDPLRGRAARRLVPILRAALTEELPEYMVPATLMVLEDLPRLPSGKIDRHALPRPDAGRDTGTRSLEGRRFRDPNTATEKTLVEIWTELLGIDRIGVDDNFFELGGDSILSIQVVARAARRGLRLAPRDLFRHQTVAELAELATAASSPLPPQTEQGRIQGSVPLVPIQHWFFALDLPEPWHFNQATCFELDPSLAPTVLCTAAARLLDHHDGLRLRFVKADDGWRQAYAPGHQPLPFTWIDLTQLAEHQLAPAMTCAAATLQASLDLAAGPLLRLAYCTTRVDRPARLLAVIHHLVVDGVSWRVLIEDLEILCHQLAAGETPDLGPKTTSFKAWAQRLAAYAGSAEARREAAWWQHARWQRRGDRPARLPFDKSEGSNTQATAARVQVSLGSAATHRLLREVPAAYRTRINDVLLTALVRSFAPWLGERRLLVGLEGHGREEIGPGVDLSRTVGWFTTLFPICLDLRRERQPVAGDGDIAFGEDLKTVKEQLRAVPRQGLSFGVQRYMSLDRKAAAALAALPEPEVSFNYLGQLDAAPLAAQQLRRVAAAMGADQGRGGRRPHLIDINSGVSDGRLWLTWTYSRNRHLRTTIEGLAGAFLEQLEALIIHCCSPPAGGSTPSDFPLAELDQQQLDRLIGTAQGIEDIYPLTPLQQGLLFHALYTPGSTVYFAQSSWTLRGALDIEAWWGAWHQVVERHPALRTAFAWEGLERPLQIVHRHAEPTCEEHDWRDLRATEQRDRLAALLVAERQRGFNLALAPLLRLILIRLGPDSYHFVWNTHHTVVDGWSTPLILSECFAFYNALRRGHQTTLPRPRPYRDYIAWLAEHDPRRTEAFWRRRLAGFRRPTPLPLAGPAVGGRFAAAARRHARLQLDELVSDQLASFARRHRLTLNTVTQGAWALLLARSGDEREVLFGATVSGRPATLDGTESIVGMFINTLPVRLRLPGDEPAADWLRTVQEQGAQLRDYEHSPLSSIQGWSDLPRDRPLFESLLVFENYPLQRSGAPLDGLEISKSETHHETSFPLSLMVAPGRRLTLAAKCDAERFDTTAPARLLRQFATLLRGLAADVGGRPQELPILDRAERHQTLVEWNDYGANFQPPATLFELVARQIARTPEAVAVTCGDAHLSFGDLERRATALSRRLQRHAAGPESLVAVCLERSLELIVALLAILRTGAAYLPLEPSYPRHRLAFMLRDSAVSLLLTHGDLAQRLGLVTSGMRVLQVEPPLPATAEPGPSPYGDPRTAAYIYYTSGSTGQPKGAVNTHRAIINRLLWMQDTLKLTPEDRVLQKTPIGFDVSVWEIFWPLSAGARLVSARPEGHRDPAYLQRMIVEHGITTLHFVPSMLRAFLEEPEIERCDSLRLVVASGEALSAELQESFFAYCSAELYNLYGPTEAAVGVTAWHCQRGASALGQPVPIGRPIANLRLQIHDSNGRPLPAGMPGELMISGVALARGYLGRPALTAERFVPDPSTAARKPGGRLYRTSDRVCYRTDSSVLFLGRLDHQLKIRGQRVEPGEIEAILASHPALREAAVVANWLAPDDPQLIAFVVPRRGVPAVPAASELRPWLGERLPGHMVPAVFEPLAAMPLNPSGKLDRKALSLPAAARHKVAEHMVAPRSPVEEMLAGIWSALLGGRAVGVHDDFFELGGHSLLATRIVSRLRRLFGVELALQDFFDHPTVAQFGERVSAALQHKVHPSTLNEEALTAEALPPIVPVPRHREQPLSFAQQRLWFLSLLEPWSPAYNMPTSLRVQGPLVVPALERALAEIVRRHETLRTTFEDRGSRPVQVIAAATAPPLPRIDLERLAEDHRRTESQRLAERDAERPFDLRDSPLRLALVRLGSLRHLLLCNLHHIASDGWSQELFERELAALYSAFTAGQPSPLPEITVQYADFAHWQRGAEVAALHARQLDYWLRHLADLPRLELPSDRSRPALQSYRGGAWHSQLSAAIDDALATFCIRHGVSAYMVLLTALFALLGRLTGRPEVVVGSPIANRNREEVEDLIGFFVNMLVLRGDLTGDASGRELLQRVRQLTLEAFTHQDLPFEQLVDKLSPDRDLSRHPLVQMLFVVQGAARSTTRLPGLDATPQPTAIRRVRFDLETHFWPTDRGWRGLWIYSTDLFDRTTIARLAGHYTRFLGEMLATPERRLSELPLLAAVERHQIVVEWNAQPLTSQPPERGLHQMVTAQAARTPDAVAMVAGQQHLTYQRLAHRSARLARHLRSLGVGPETPVALAVERDLDLGIAVLGILRAGGVCVPLDPNHPRRRLAFVLADTGAPLLLTQRRLTRRLVDLGTPLVMLEDVPLERVDRAPEEVLPPTADPASLAYVLYTSGSTGRPKGVAMAHGPLGSLMRWQRDRSPRPDARTAQLAAIGFDVSFQELFATWSCGGALVMVPEGMRRDAPSLARFLARRRVERLFLPFIALQQLAEAASLGQAPDGLREVITAGEALRVTTSVRALFNRLQATLDNQYGPTESHVVSAFALTGAPSSWQSAPPIGMPVARVRLLVLDHQLATLPIGVPGELMIAGGSLARGYLRRPALTAERFVPDPTTETAGARLYRSGDVARYVGDGTLEFLGRVDQQVKVSGYRIEPGEIESTLAAHPMVAEAVVTAPETASGRRLVAYVVATNSMPDAQLGPGRTPQPADSEAWTAMLRSWLQERLPANMVPAALVLLERLPLTASGKVDRRALPAPGAARDTKPVAPRGSLETTLAEIWRELLEVDSLGVRDDFFALGGHSLLAVRLVARIYHRLGIELPLASLFQAPTIERLAALLAEPAAQAMAPLVAIRTQGRRPPFFCIHPGGGQVLCYAALAQHLDAEQPFYGLQASGTDGSGNFQREIPQMAALYLRALRTVQTAGPIHLGGWSMGGAVAYEMAQQLTANGEQVALLVLIDTYRPLAGKLVEPAEARGLVHFARDLGLSEDELGMSWSALGQLPSTAALLHIHRAARPLLGPEISSERLRHLYRLFRNNLKAMHRYRPQPWPGRLSLLRAAGQPVPADPTLGWSELAGTVDVATVPGDHFDLLRAPHVKVLAERLTALLRAANSGDEP